jgi:hypothetical protein
VTNIQKGNLKYLWKRDQRIFNASLPNIKVVKEWGIFSIRHTLKDSKSVGLP